MKNKSLVLRDNGVKLINDIRMVRAILTKSRFDERNFDNINGTDGSLESLVGHDVVFANMDHQKTVNLRREILGKLTENEYSALKAMRESLEGYFSEISDKVRDVIDSDTKSIARMSDESVEAKLNSSCEYEGCFSVEALKNIEEAFESLTDFLNRVSPFMLSVYTAEQQEGEAAEEAPPAEDEPNPPETEEVGHQVYTKETEDAITEVINTCKNNVSISACNERFVHSGNITLSKFGYKTKKDVIDSIKRIENIRSSYVEALENFRKSIPVDTCPLEDFARNSSEFYSAVEAIVGLINNANELDSRLVVLNKTLHLI